MESSPKMVENTGKAGIARNEQFLLFPQYFQKTGTADTGLFWERVKSSNTYLFKSSLY